MLPSAKMAAVAQPAKGQKVEALLVDSSKVELPNYRTCSAPFSFNDQRDPPLRTHAALQPEQSRQTLKAHFVPQICWTFFWSCRHHSVDRPRSTRFHLPELQQKLGLCQKYAAHSSGDLGHWNYLGR